MEELKQILTTLEQSCFDHPWKEHQIQEELQREDSLLLLCDADGNSVDGEDWSGSIQPVGYLFARILLADRTSDILRIAVLPEYRKRGFARAMLRRLEKEAGLYMDRPMFLLLDVSDANTAALRLYESEGFKVIHTRKKYYPDSSAALIMRKDVL